MKPTIFVHLISYRDPELLPSVLDCYANATHPERLRFGVVWQHDADERQLETYLGHPQFRILDIPASEAKGCCWARAQAQGLYRGEDYVLQLDSHHRFEPGWDETLIEMMRQTGSEKPMITGYASGYDAINGKHAAVPLVIRLRPFNEDGSIMFYGCSMSGWEKRTAPMKARIASGHFMFTLGKHCLEVPWDPDLYFLGEEIVMAARSFTHGFDMFHPHKVVIWHQYGRDGRVKIWDDKPAMHHERDKVSKERVLKLMGMEDNAHDLGRYGLGTERTLREFEEYVGIDFARRLIHQDAMDGAEPPTGLESVSMAACEAVLMQWRQELAMPDDLAFITYTVETASGKVIYRKDAHENDAFLPPAKVLVASLEPAERIVVWPQVKDGSKTKGGPVRYIVPLKRQVVFSPS